MGDHGSIEDKFLEKAEKFMKQANGWADKGGLLHEELSANYSVAIYYAIKALYEQNKALIYITEHK